MNRIHTTIRTLGAAGAILAAATAQVVVEPARITTIRPQQPVRALSLRAQVSIQDGIATTELVQVLLNEGGGQAEATWLLPLPDGATADGFTMVVGGQEMRGEVLDAGKARGIYEEIVRRRRDPGLLEYTGHGCLRARVFPIPPRQKMEVRVRYRQVLPRTGNLLRYAFAARGAGLDGQPAEQIALDLRIRSRQPIKNVWSPLAGLDVVRQGEHEARATLELRGGQLPARDPEVFYGVSEQAFGLDVLTWRDGADAGYYALMLSPQHDWPEPKNTVRFVQFVLDTSGSMRGKKIEQARGALRFFVQSLRPGDRFNVIPFSTEARPFFAAPVEVSAETVALALEKTAALEANGGTNIEDALRTALRAELPEPCVPQKIMPITVFLTDGLPTVGTTDLEALRRLVKESNAAAARMFVFGVGNDVNTQLLDRMAEDTRGDRDYVREHEDIEVKTAALFTKLANPVMTGLRIACDGIELIDGHPRDLPDLFKGSHLMVLGRYRGDGCRAIRLSGDVDGTRREYVFEATFPARSTEHDFVPVLWAQRKVAALLDAIRLNGQQQELVEEVRRLGKQFGIVTPFTSHLIVEEGMQLAQRWGIATPQGEEFATTTAFGRVAEELRRAGAPAPSAPADLGRVKKEAEQAAERLTTLDAVADGREAVARSVNLLALRAETKDSGGGGKQAAALVARRVGGRQLHLAGGVWLDAALTPALRADVRTIEAFSDEYFALLAAHPELAPVLAFSTRLVLVVDGRAVEIR